MTIGFHEPPTLTDREREILATLDDAARAHPLARDAAGTLRFVADPLIAHLTVSDCRPGGGPFDLVRRSRTGIDLNVMWVEAVTYRIPPESVLRFYRDMGYSVGGYDEIIAGHREYFRGVAGLAWGGDAPETTDEDEGGTDDG